MNDRVVAVIYPLELIFIERFFNGDKDVFVKYTPYPFTKIKEGDKLLFYQTQSNNRIVGEAKIAKKDFLDMENALKKYKRRIFLSKEELLKYSRGRTKKMLILVVEDAIKYKNPIPLKKNLTMAGLHLSLEKYKELLENN